MSNPVGYPAREPIGYRLRKEIALIATTVAMLFQFSGALWAQQAAEIHLNPAIAKLEQGKPIIGITSHDLSMQNCHHLARVNYDYVYIDMEHSPLDFNALAWCVGAMVDKAAALKKGNPQPNVAVLARFPPEGGDLEDNEWMVKQALDIGLMGIIFNGVDNKEQMTHLIRFMRYPQGEDSKYPQPPGLRGLGPTNALFAWGVSIDEYMRDADVWPLNPQGDLLAIAMIESKEGLENVDEIASVPGLGAIYFPAGNDMHLSLGVPLNSPEMEAARQKVLAACKTHKVVCGISVTTQPDADKRLSEGWRMIKIGEPGD